MNDIFVNESNIETYELRTIAITRKNEEKLLEKQKLNANKYVDELTVLEQKLIKGLALAQTLYENAQLPLSDPEIHKYPPYYHQRVQMAYIIASRAQGTVNEVLTALLAPAVILPHNIRHIKATSIAALINEYGEEFCDILRGMSQKSRTSDELDDEIYLLSEKKMFDSIINEIKKRQGPMDVKMQFPK